MSGDKSKKRKRKTKFSKASDDDKIPKVFCMQNVTFSYILSKIEDKLVDVNRHRQTITASDKLQITLKYLSENVPISSLTTIFKCRTATVTEAIEDTIFAIWEEFKELHMPNPTPEIFKNNAEEFYEDWNYPHCVGCLESKTVKVKNCFVNCNKLSLDYRKNPHVVVQAVVDASYRFVYVDVSLEDRNSGPFIKSTLYEKIRKKKISFPEEEDLPDTCIRAPFVLLGSKTFPLKTFLLRPYLDRVLGRDQIIFNIKLKETRRVAEIAFKILVSKFEILTGEFEMSRKKTCMLVKCMCLLHNIIVDLEGVDDGLIEELDNLRTLRNYEGEKERKKASFRAYHVRDIFKDYFKYDF